jgi:hypothetical protein
VPAPVSVCVWTDQGYPLRHFVQALIGFSLLQKQRGHGIVDRGDHCRWGRREKEASSFPQRGLMGGRWGGNVTQLVRAQRAVSRVHLPSRRDVRSSGMPGLCLAREIPSSLARELEYSASVNTHRQLGCSNECPRFRNLRISET